MIPSYINTLITDTGNIKDIALRKEPKKIKENISICAEKIIGQPIDVISRNDVESFIKEIYILESNIQKAAVTDQIPVSVLEYYWTTTDSKDQITLRAKPKDKHEEKVCRRIEKATKKIFERELMALSKSTSETAISRHEDNLIFLESFMALHHMKGASSSESFRERLLRKDAIKLLNKIAKKPINKIVNYEVDKIVEFGYKADILKTGKREYEEKIMKYEPIENPSSLNNMDRSEERVNIEIIQDALDKLIEREEIALSNSFYDDAIKRHNYNLDALRWMRGPEI
jgi:hypothetical protein